MRLIKGVSKISDGNMSLKWGIKEEVDQNRSRFLGKLGIEMEECVLMSLVHGTDVVEVGIKDKGSMIEADGLITNTFDVGLLMVTADCLPVVLYDSKGGRVGLVHLGWRGVDRKLIAKMVIEMRKRGSEADSINVWIGPGVRKGSYKKWGKGWEEFEELRSKENIKEWDEFVERVDEDKRSLDLVGYVKKQLIAEGVRNKIEVSEVDTVTDGNYFSHHRSYLTGETEGRFATVVMMRSE